jgi:hypothetical protein
VQAWEKRQFVPAPHQRDFRWPDEKRREFVNTIRESSNPPGIIETYAIVERGQGNKLHQVGPIYVNDGRQRLGTATLYRQEPHVFGDSKDNAEKILSACRYAVNHRHYFNHGKALYDFWVVNYGMTMTAFEMCDGILVYMDLDNYDTVWEPLLEDLHTIMEANSKRMCNTIAPDATNHKLKRHNYSLFTRFTEENNTFGNLTSPSEVKIKAVVKESTTIVEYRLRAQLQRLGQTGSREALERFGRFVDRETTTIRDVFSSIDNNPNSGIKPTVYRWLLDIAIWKHYNSFAQKTQKWESFIRDLIVATRNGRSAEILNDDEKVLFGLGKINDVKRVCRAIGSDFVDIEPRRRKKGTALDGADMGHKLPFAIYGEGETRPEPSSRNRARGARE